MEDNPDIDIVDVVTPNSLHAEHAIAAAKAGKHVICEKPMATTVEDCDAIIAACKDVGVRLGMGYRLHYEPSHIELKRLPGEMGRRDMVVVEAIYASAAADGKRMELKFCL